MKNLKYFLIAVALVFTSCSKDEDQNSGSLQEVHDFLSPEIVDAMIDLGLNINTGDNPPNIEGLYLAELILEDSSVPDEPAPIGHRFPDWKFKFSEQNGSSLFVEEFEDASGTTGNGYGGLIVGEGELFTVLVKQELTDGYGHSYTNVRAISGDRYGSIEQTVSILDFQLATFMMDNNGNPNGNLLPDNTGRLFSDENDAATRITNGG